MKKIMFNDDFQLTVKVCMAEKTETRRIAFGKVYSRNNPDEEKQIEDLYEKDGVWFYTAAGREPRQLNKRLYPKYKVGETVAVAEQYLYIYRGYEKTTDSWGNVIQIREHKGWMNKMYVKPELMSSFIIIDAVKAHRIQDITEEECKAEGLETIHIVGSGIKYICGRHGDWVDYTPNPKIAYEYMFKKLYGKKMWEDNPWVYAYKFHLKD